MFFFYKFFDSYIKVIFIFIVFLIIKYWIVVLYIVFKVIFISVIIVGFVFCIKLNIYISIVINVVFINVVIGNVIIDDFGNKISIIVVVSLDFFVILIILGEVKGLFRMFWKIVFEIVKFELIKIVNIVWGIW